MLHPVKMCIRLVPNYLPAFRLDLEMVRYSSLGGETFSCSSEPSRRDDLEALGNCLLYLHSGDLPWHQTLYSHDSTAKSQHMAGTLETRLRSGPDFEELLSQFHPLFGGWFQYCRSLAFAEDPDYNCLLDHLREGIGQMETAFVYDWMNPKLESGTLLSDEYIPGKPKT